MAEIEFLNVVKIFDEGTYATRDVSLKIDDGEFMVFVGPSGCGKSTLLRMLAGLEDVSSGDILIGGAIVNDWSPQQRNVAMVFQNYALYPHMTVRRNLEFPLRMSKVAKQEMHQRVAETGELLGLTELMDRKPKQLSGGQRQRVAMGRAVVRNPSVFLMDEPLSNLDAKLRVQIRTDIAALQRRLGTTTIYVTHDQVEAMTLGERVAVLHRGVLQQVAPPRELYHRPANTFVASFLGSPGMNLIPARLTREQRDDLMLHVGEQGRGVRLDSSFVQNCPIDEPILAGIRPETLTPVDEKSDRSALRVKVETVESLGHEQLVYSQLPEWNVPDTHAAEEHVRSLGHSPNELVARLPSDLEINSGTDINLGLNAERIYLFNTDGSAITQSRV